MRYDIYLNGTKVGKVNSEDHDHLMLVKGMYPDTYKVSVNHEDKIVHVRATLEDAIKCLESEIPMP